MASKEFENGVKRAKEEILNKYRNFLNGSSYSFSINTPLKKENFSLEKLKKALETGQLQRWRVKEILREEGISQNIIKEWEKEWEKQREIARKNRGY